MAIFAVDMDVDDPQKYRTYKDTPSRLRPLRSSAPLPWAPVPPPLAGKKRPRDIFEPEPPRTEPPRTVYENPPRSANGPKEPHTAPPPPVQRFLIRIGGGVSTAARFTLAWAGARLSEGLVHVRAFFARRAAAPAEYFVVVETGAKRRAVTPDATAEVKPEVTPEAIAEAIPGSYPNTPIKGDAASAAVQKKSSPSGKAKSRLIKNTLSTKSYKTQASAKVPILATHHGPVTVMTAQHNTTAAPEAAKNVASTSANAHTLTQPNEMDTSLSADEPTLTQLNENISSLAVNAPTIPQQNMAATNTKAKDSAIPAAKPKGTGPTPPDSRSTSSLSQRLLESRHQVLGVQPKDVLNGRKLPPPRPKLKGRTLDPPQPKHMTRGYRQPFDLSWYTGAPGQEKSILKKTSNNRDLDANIDNLIRRAKTVTIESPEEKAIRYTYRRRKEWEKLDGDRQMLRNRDETEEQQEREAEAAHQAEVQAAQVRKNRLSKEAEDKRIEEAEAEIARLKLEQEDKERLRKEEEEKIAAEKKKIKDEKAKKKAAEAEERRLAQESKIAAKSASLPKQIIKTLSPEWEEKVYQAMEKKNFNATVARSAEGNELTRKDFGTLLPQQGTQDDPSGWLNDDIVNGVVTSIVAADKERTGYKKGKGVPESESYSSQWYKTYQSQGIDGIGRWSRRKGIQGAKLLQCKRIYFPTNTGNHWTLLIISPRERKIEYLDSLHMRGGPKRFFAIARDWLAMELGGEYKAEEWKDVYESVSERQSNSNDCGVFTCFNALANAKFGGKEYSMVDASRMPQARKILAAVLIAGKLDENFDLA